MEPEKLVEAIREESLEGLVTLYADMFTSTPISKFSDSEMLMLAERWQASDPAMRKIFESFMRHGAQNSIASVLGMIDHGAPLLAKDLILTDKDGKIMSGNLLDFFWEQEELAGRVNKKAEN